MVDAGEMLIDRQNIATAFQIFLGRQGFLGANGKPLSQDGNFGPNSRFALNAFQRLNALPITNEIDEATAGCARALGMWPFKQARNYTRLAVPRTECRWVVIHTAQTPETATAARGVANFFANQPAHGALDSVWCHKDKAGNLVPWSGASALATVDAYGIYQHVREGDVAWHAGGANRYGLGIEHAGTAEQRAAGWADDYSVAMLQRSARLVAELCTRWGIPRERITPADYKAGKRGILGHVDVNAATGGGGHTDPGPDFPWDRHIALVQGVA